MFLNRMVLRSLSRQLSRRVLIAVSVGLSACVSVAMLGVVFDVGDKLNAELSTYGSNIMVQPKSDAVVSDLYAAGDSDSSGSAMNSDPTAFIKESDIAKIKTIFWAYNITDFAPQLNTHATIGVNCKSSEGSSQASCTSHSVPLVGTWFNKRVTASTGESSTVGVRGMRSWWKLQGSWAKDDTNQAMIGSNLAKELAATVGDTLTVAKGKKSQQLQIVGIYDSGDDDNDAVYLSSSVAQDLAELPDQVDRVEVKALTTPENDLARKAARNPGALSQEDWETWYCTAYPSSIAYQIEEVIPGSVAKQVRQIAALQGDVMKKTQAVMILMTALSLLAAAIAVANLMAAAISERSSEFALLKAIGATDGSVSRLVLLETASVSIVGAVVGAGLGSLMAQVVGHVVFGSGITMRPMVFVLVFVLLAVTILAASLSGIRSILRLRPAEVLHGR
ncbi:MAG: ABC transporter permease [Bifidobacterium sp.]|nr:ABC transporter permease [Bifidobacterium sp.]MCH4174890.1 ABC transporter permease [Bifidobacterium sp.]